MLRYLSLFLALVFYGLSTTLQKKALKYISLRNMLKIHAYVTFILYALFWYFFSREYRAWPYFYPMLSALTSALGFILYYEALKFSSASLVALITSLYAVVSFVLSVIFLGECPAWNNYTGFALIIAGLLFIYKKGSGKNISFKGLILTLSATILWGCWGFLSKKAYEHAGEPELLGSFALMVILIFSLYAGRLKKDEEDSATVHRGDKVAILSVVITAAASLLFYFSIGRMPATFVIPVISGYPLITIISAAVLLRERLTGRQLFASVLIICGIMLFFIF